MEIWKDIEGYEGLYSVSNLGNVKSIERNIILKPCIACGYYRLNLWKNKTKKNYLIHRLVAKAFIPNMNNKPEVNHIDHDCFNNKVGNLQWVTSKENSQFAALHGRRQLKISFADRPKIKKNFLLGLFTKNELARQYGVSVQSIMYLLKSPLY